MFDINTFKKNIKIWTEKHPAKSKASFLDYCEGLLPIKKQNEYCWLLDQASMWFENANKNRESNIILKQK